MWEMLLRGIIEACNKTHFHPSSSHVHSMTLEALFAIAGWRNKPSPQKLEPFVALVKFRHKTLVMFGEIYIKKQC